MVNRGQAYAIAGVASAAVAALLTAPYRAIDVSLLTFSVLVIAEYCLRKAELPPWLRLSKPEVRSKVFRYASIAERGGRDGSGNPIGTESSEVLSASELRHLPRDELAKLEAKLRAGE